LRNRKGLTKLNSVAAAGAITGAIGVPIEVGTAGNEIPAVSSASRFFLAGRRITSTTAGWNTSSDIFVTSVTTGGPDGFDASATPRVPDNLWTGMAESGTTLAKERAFRSGRPGVMYQNRFYYAGNDYTFQSTTPTIRMYDGTADYFIARIPKSAGTTSEAIIDIIVGNEKIYCTVHDSGLIANNTLKARVFELDPESGVIKQMGGGFPLSPETARVPYALVWHMGRLWTRTHGAGIGSIAHLVYYFRPGIDSAWTVETPEASALSSNVLASYQGQLYMGLPEQTGTGARIIVRSPIAAYTTSLTAAVGDASPSLGSLGYANHFGAMATFGGNLYASYYNQRGSENDNTLDKFARIYKYNGTSWTVVFNPAANDTSSVPYSFAVVLGGRLFFVSAPARTNVNTVNHLVHSSDGTTWTAVSSVLDDTSTGTLGMIAS